jgi:predicted transposase YdaD
VLKLLSVMSGDRRYEEIFADDRKDEVTNMSSLVERLVNQGRAEAIERMLQRGRTPEEIAEFCGYDIEMVKDIEKHSKALPKAK